MSGAWRSLRVRLAVLGFVAIYLPVLLLFGVTSLAEVEISQTRDGVEIASETSSSPSPWVIWTVVALAPAAAGLAWWWAGRAVRPIDHVRGVAEEIEASELDRRIGLEDGPAEVVSLAASFDAMLDRLHNAAEMQRRLIEETSHELRTPISVLTTNADVLLAHPDPTSQLYRDGLERSKAVAVQLQRVIDDLLVDARGRARTIDRRPADLAVITRRVSDDARVLAAAENVALSISSPETVPCSLDEPTVRRAISNLVDNAIRHAPPGSVVDVAVEAGDGQATVLVVDHGAGIPEAEQQRIFERFWRGGGDSPGTGLGLPIARQIALAHGGDLTVRSPGPAGDGCVFRLSLRR